VHNCNPLVGKKKQIYSATTTQGKPFGQRCGRAWAATPAEDGNTRRTMTNVKTTHQAQKQHQNTPRKTNKQARSASEREVGIASKRERERDRRWEWEWEWESTCPLLYRPLG